MKFKFFNSGTEVRPSSDPQGSQGQDGNSSGRTDSVRSAFGSILTISSKVSTNSEEVRKVDLFVYKKKSVQCAQERFYLKANKLHMWGGVDLFSYCTYQNTGE